MKVLRLYPLHLVVLLLLVEGLAAEFGHSLCLSVAESLNLLGTSVALLSEDS